MAWPGKVVEAERRAPGGGLDLRCLTLVLAAGFLLPRPALAQSDPCVYREADGRVVITDSGADPRCAYLRRKPVFRRPGRLRVTGRIADVIALAHDAAERHRVDHRLVESLVEMESGFDPNAVSARGAMGLMQLMPEVARRYGVLDPFDPRQNLDAGVRHLRGLLLEYGADLGRALAAYNAGEGAVARYAGIPPYRETQDYVRRVLYRYRQRVEGPALH